MGGKNHTSMAQLIQQHGWRVAIIVSCLIMCIIKIMEEEQENINIQIILLSLIIANWLRLEIKTILIRTNLPPGEVGFPFVGELNPIYDPYGNTTYKKQKYGLIFYQNLPFGPIVTCGGAHEINFVWNAERKNQLESRFPTSMTKLLGNHALIQLSGKRHRTLKRLLEPAFAPTATKDYTAAIDKLVTTCLTEWSQDDTFHSSKVFKMFALKGFFTAAIGSLPNKDFIDQLHNDYILWTNGLLSLVPYRIPGIQTSYSKAMDARERILKAVEELVEKFKKDNPKSSPKSQNCMMGRICWSTDENGKPMEMEELKDNILLMIFAGHDTTYCSIGTALHHLYAFPDIQQALREEVNGFQEPLDYEELKNAPILNAFMTECWRIRPPVPGSHRITTRPLEYEGYKFPKGLKLSYNVIAATTNEEIYKEPTRFAIERFLPKDHPLRTSTNNNRVDVDSAIPFTAESESLSKGTFPIFGGGVHGCLGTNFAKLEMRVLITRLLQGYDLEVKNSTKFSFPLAGWKNEFKLSKI